MSFTSDVPSTAATNYNLAATGTATLLAAEGERDSITLYNESLTVRAYFGFTSGITTSTGFPLPVDSMVELTGYNGPIYVITGGSTGDVRGFAMRKHAR